MSQLLKTTILICTILFSMEISTAQDKITIDTSADGEQFEHFWSKCLGAGRANEALSAGRLEQIKTVQKNRGKDEYLFVSRNSGDGKVSVMAYNFPKEFEGAVPAGNNKLEKGTSKPLNFSIINLNPGIQFIVETLDKDHGNIHNYWEKMGKPEPLTREQVI